MEGKDMINLEDYKVGCLQTLFYIPNFITDSEQTQLLHHINEVPPSKWKSLKNRRLQNWGGVVHEKGLLPQELPIWLKRFTERIYQKTGLFPSAINHVLINEYLPDQGIMPHQDGPAYFPVVAIISLESPIVIDFSPHPRLNERPSNDQCIIEDNLCSGAIHRCSLLLEPRSLLIFKDAAYSDYLHGIADTRVQKLHQVVNVVGAHDERVPRSCSTSQHTEQFDDHQLEGNILHRTSTRTSLTCRLVLKVHKNLFKF